jgi:cytochrome c-type biogenesis protein CcmH/NrfF
MNILYRLIAAHADLLWMVAGTLVVLGVVITLTIKRRSRTDPGNVSEEEPSRVDDPRSTSSRSRAGEDTSL